MKRVVVFFPSWRYFGHFALPLFARLTDRFEIVFLHTERAIYGWDDCPDLSDQGIETVDLSSLKTASFVKALRMLNPDAVVVFDKGWMQDRAVLHAAQFFGIRSFHIQHGIIAPLSKVKTQNSLRRGALEFVKVFRTFWLYNRTLQDIGGAAWRKSLRYQGALLSNPNDYYYNDRDEVQADLAGIIGKRDRTFFVEREGYTVEQLIPFGALQFEAAYRLSPREPQDQLLLITQPLFEDHVLTGGMSAKEQHLREMINSSPLPVAIKPHPREDRNWYEERFSAEELRLYPAVQDINEAILDSSHVVGYFSTALINALILKRPVGIIRWVDDGAYVLNLDVAGDAVPLHSVIEISDFITKDSAYNIDVDPYCYDVNPIDTIKKILEHF
ncbi:MAG: polysialyltransferase family glycosyltransferase [Pontiellaceae bacterium]